jgi:GntR family transcriptional regulator, transcriptional repressor for pyruvate dehydrogenase complex
MTEQNDIEDLMEVRIALESVTAASAALKRSEQDLIRLQNLLAKMDAALKDQKRFAALDFEFHITLAEVSEKILIIDMVAMIRGQLEKALSRVLLLPNARPLSLKEHISIVNAVKRRDCEAARKAMQSHLKAALGRYHHAVGSKHVVVNGAKLRKVATQLA